MALALSLPQTFVYRDMLLALTLGYVTFSLVVGGLTMKPLLNRLGLTYRSESRERWESLLAQLRMVSATQQTINQLSHQHLLPPALDENFRHAIKSSLDHHWTQMEQVLLEDPDLMRARTQYILNEIVRARRAALLDLEQRGFIYEQTYEKEMEHLVQQTQQAFEAESSEQIYTILTGLIGRWDHFQGLQQMLRESPALTSQIAKTYLSQAANQTLDSLIESQQIVEPFVADELRPYLADLETSTAMSFRESVSENPKIQMQATRLVMRELLDGQRAALAQMMRTGLLDNGVHVRLNQRLDAIEAIASEMNEPQELNALMLAVPGMIRHLDESLLTGVGSAATADGTE